jgi:hypothetical protein
LPSRPRRKYFSALDKRTFNHQAALHTARFVHLIGHLFFRNAVAIVVPGDVVRDDDDHSPADGIARLGQDADGNKRYARLITFRALSDAEPIAAKAKKAIRA